MEQPKAKLAHRYAFMGRTLECSLCFSKISVNYYTSVNSRTVLKEISGFSEKLRESIKNKYVQRCSILETRCPNFQHRRSSGSCQDFKISSDGYYKDRGCVETFKRILSYPFLLQDISKLIVYRIYAFCRPSSQCSGALLRLFPCKVLTAEPPIRIKQIGVLKTGHNLRTGCSIGGVFVKLCLFLPKEKLHGQ